MQYATRVAFVPDGPFIVATRNFVYAGRPYAKGEPFDSTGLDRFQLFDLWNALQLDVAPQLEPARPGTMQTATVASGHAVVAMPGVASGEVAQRVERRERKNKRRW